MKQQAFVLIEKSMSDDTKYPPVLDACCGGRMMWFNKTDDRAVCVDRRAEKYTMHRPKRNVTEYMEVAPDQVADFTDLPFPDNTFAHVVFDPPHCRATEGRVAGINAKWYGLLFDGWQEMLRRGFAECFRVLRPEGTLVFKWNEQEIPVREILALTPEKPLYGHRSGKQSKTHWIAFLKPNATHDTQQSMFREEDSNAKG